MIINCNQGNDEDWGIDVTIRNPSNRTETRRIHDFDELDQLMEVMMREDGELKYRICDLDFFLNSLSSFEEVVFALVGGE